MADDCPRCGAPPGVTGIHGLCVSCLARSADDLLNLSVPSPPLDLPPTLQGYEIIAPLGIGGMGQVFEAMERDRVDGLIVTDAGDHVTYRIVNSSLISRPDTVCPRSIPIVSSSMLVVSSATALI